MKQPQVYNLPFDRTLPYFLNHIGCGKYLSESICKNVDFNKGRFFTVLPADTNLKKILQFEYGGIIASNDFDGSKTIVTMDDNCSRYIYNYLSGHKSHVAVIENYMLDPKSDFVNITNVQMSSLDSEVYYTLSNNNSVKEIYKTIRKSSLVWHFLAVLSHVKTDIPTNFTKDCIDNICKNAKFVIAGAYDGEGYIFWEREE